MNVHAIVSRYDTNAYGLISPQVPALFAGSDSPGAYETERIPALLAESGLEDNYQLQVHRQTYEQFEDREWFMRVKVDRPFDVPSASRRHTWEALERLLEETPEPIDNARPNSTGEVIFIICELDDTIGWVSEQLLEGETAALVTPVGAEELWVLDVHKGVTEGAERLDDSVTLRELQQRFLGATDELQSRESFVMHEPTPGMSRTRQLVGV